jgi:hypothetical protein
MDLFPVDSNLLRLSTQRMQLVSEALADPCGDFHIFAVTGGRSDFQVLGGARSDAFAKKHVHDRFLFSLLYEFHLRTRARSSSGGKRAMIHLEYLDRSLRRGFK